MKMRWVFHLYLISYFIYIQGHQRMEKKLIWSKLILSFSDPMMSLFTHNLFICHFFFFLIVCDFLNKLNLHFL